MSYDTWVQVRSLVDWVCEHWDQPDLSIWEVRGERQNFLYSKVRPRCVLPIATLRFRIAHIRPMREQIMCWVAIDRGLRLAEKRSLPAPNRHKWIEIRDHIYEEVQTKGFNQKEGFFAQVRVFFARSQLGVS